MEAEPPDFLGDLYRAINDGTLQQWTPPDQPTVPVDFTHTCPLCGILHGLEGPCAACLTNPGFGRAMAAWHAPWQESTGKLLTYAQLQTSERYRRSGSYVNECRAILTRLVFD